MAEDLRRSERERKAEKSADQRKDGALDQQLLHQPPAARAERESNADLLATARGAGEQQVADVRARADEYDRHEREQRRRQHRHQLPLLLFDAARRERSEVEPRVSRAVGTA